MLKGLECGSELCWPEEERLAHCQRKWRLDPLSNAWEIPLPKQEPQTPRIRKPVLSPGKLLQDSINRMKQVAETDTGALPNTHMHFF